MDPLEKLSIETPEQVRLEYSLAGLGSRFLAIAFDSIVQGLIGLIALLAMVIITPAVVAAGSILAMWLIALYVIFFFLLFWGYFAFFEIIWNGQTPGKRQAKIRVIKEDGRSISVYDALLRNLVRFVDLMPGIYGVGVCSIALSGQNKRLGDYAAGTVVVHDAPADALTPAALETGADAQAAGYPTSQLGVEDLELIETFLQRRYDLPLDIRSTTAQRIADRIRVKLAIDQNDLSNEDFLAEVARAKRSTG